MNKCLLVILSGGVLVTTPAQASTISPLLQKLHTLQCTTDTAVAKQMLQQLFDINAPDQHWPDEWLGQKPEPSLHAGTLDIMLDILKSTAERFPDLRTEAERIALQWDYCAIVAQQGFHDLILRHNILHQSLAADDAPLKWEGFRQWGFLNPDPADRFVPRLLDEIRLAPNAYHLFLHQTYRQHCFPHPETGLLVTEAEVPPYSVANHVLILNPTREPRPSPYPFSWDVACPHPVVQPPEQDKQTPPPTTRLTHQQADKQPHAPKAGAQGEPGKAILAQRRPPNHQPKATGLATKPTRQKRPPSPAGAEQIILPTIVTTSAGAEIPIDFDIPATTLPTHTAGIRDTNPTPRRQVAIHLADTVSLKDGSNTAAVSATWSPKANWFVNGRVAIQNGKPVYSWNAGYANYNPGAVSVQIDHYDPINPGKGLDLANANLNIGYKVKSAKLEKHKLSASTSLNVSANSHASLTLQWNPKPNIYTRTTVNLPVTGDKPHWSYVAGYASPKPDGWRVEYSNYDQNGFPGDNLTDGEVTISRSWKF